MTVEKLIEALMALPKDMEVGSTNYYGWFGPAYGVVVEVADDYSPSWEPRSSFKGKKVAVIELDLDMQ